MPVFIGFLQLVAKANRLRVGEAYRGIADLYAGSVGRQFQFRAKRIVLVISRDGLNRDRHWWHVLCIVCWVEPDNTTAGSEP